MFLLNGEISQKIVYLRTRRIIMDSDHIAGVMFRQFTPPHNMVIYHDQILLFLPIVFDSRICMISVTLIEFFTR